MEVVHPTTFKPSAPVIESSERDVLINLLTRQNAADAVCGVPPSAVENDPVLVLWEKIRVARETGQSLSQYRDELHRLIQGVAFENRLTALFCQRVANRRLHRKLLATDKVEDFVCRSMVQSDMHVAEGIVALKELNRSIENDYDRLLENVAASEDIDLDAALRVMDVAAAKNEQAGQAVLDGTTPQGREFARKVNHRIATQAQAQQAAPAASPPGQKTAKP